MNNVTLIGRVGRQPELRYTNGGTAVCEITIAVDGTDDNVEWIPVVTWGATAEAVAHHVHRRAARSASRASCESASGSPTPARSATTSRSTPGESTSSPSPAAPTSPNPAAATS